MGLSPFKSCGTAPTNPVAIAPNPSPNRYRVHRVVQFKQAYVLQVRYFDCTNYEGNKILVMPGVYRGEYHDYGAGIEKFSDRKGKPKEPLDPHFRPDEGPFARFKPSLEGFEAACAIAQIMGREHAAL